MIRTCVGGFGQATTRAPPGSSPSSVPCPCGWMTAGTRFSSTCQTSLGGPMAQITLRPSGCRYWLLFKREPQMGEGAALCLLRACDLGGRTLWLSGQSSQVTVQGALTSEAQDLFRHRLSNSRECGGDVVTKLCPALATLWTAAHQAALSTGFSRQEYQNGLSCPPPGHLPNPEIKPRSPTLQVDSLPPEPLRHVKNSLCQEQGKVAFTYSEIVQFSQRKGILPIILDYNKSRTSQKE